MKREQGLRRSSKSVRLTELQKVLMGKGMFSKRRSAPPAKIRRTKDGD